MQERGGWFFAAWIVKLFRGSIDLLQEGNPGMTVGAEIFVGHVETLTRYPVKSMLGEVVGEAGVTGRGLTGDRAMAAVDAATGKVASAKRPRLWRGLLGCAASWEGERVRVTLPDGRGWHVGERGLDEALSALLGRAVRLAREAPAGPELDRAHPEAVLAQGIDADVGSDVLQMGAGAPGGTFFDFAAVHLVTTATLDNLSAGLAEGPVEAERYRPNIVVRSPAGVEGFPENGWVGGVVRIGETVAVRVVLCSPRCAIPALAHGALPARPGALRVTMARNCVEIPGFGRQPCAGVYAEVVREGMVRTGDRVTFTPA